MGGETCEFWLCPEVLNLCLSIFVQSTGFGDSGGFGRRGGFGKLSLGKNKVVMTCACVSCRRWSQER